MINLVTGDKGFVGRNLCAQLKNVKGGNPGIPVLDNVGENVNTIVVRIFLSYVGAVNKMVWQ